MTVSRDMRCVRHPHVWPEGGHSNSLSSPVQTWSGRICVLAFLFLMGCSQVSNLDTAKRLAVEAKRKANDTEVQAWLDLHEFWLEWACNLSVGGLYRIAPADKRELVMDHCFRGLSERP